MQLQWRVGVAGQRCLLQDHRCLRERPLSLASAQLITGATQYDGMPTNRLLVGTKLLRFPKYSLQRNHSVVKVDNGAFYSLKIYPDDDIASTPFKHDELHRKNGFRRFPPFLYAFLSVVMRCLPVVRNYGPPHLDVTSRCRRWCSRSTRKYRRVQSVQTSAVSRRNLTLYARWSSLFCWRRSAVC